MTHTLIEPTDNYCGKSTRIKAALIGADHAPIAAGSHDWENQFVSRSWTYSLDAVWTGLRHCYAALADDVQDRFGTDLTTVGALGVSAMMHGYLAFDADGELLTPFRTWRNTNTGPAVDTLFTAALNADPDAGGLIA